jgi:hypothetical protein
MRYLIKDLADLLALGFIVERDPDDTYGAAYPHAQHWWDIERNPRDEGVFVDVRLADSPIEFGVAIEPCRSMWADRMRDSGKGLQHVSCYRVEERRQFVGALPETWSGFKIEEAKNGGVDMFWTRPTVNTDGLLTMLKFRRCWSFTEMKVYLPNETGDAWLVRTHHADGTLDYRFWDLRAIANRIVDFMEDPLAWVQIDHPDSPDKFAKEVAHARAIGAFSKIPSRP